MKNLLNCGRTFAALALLGLGTSTLLTGCFEKEEHAAPTGSVCDTAATVIDQSATGGTLALQLADGTVLTPTGSTWANFAPTAGQQVTVGIAGKGGRGNCGGHKAASTSPELGCITSVTVATTTTKAAGGN